VLAQVVLIFAGVLGLLGLLAEAKAPLEKSMAEAIIAQRNQDLLAIQQRVYDSEKERHIS
jgi:Tfp pilus assembly protein PilV